MADPVDTTDLDNLNVFQSLKSINDILFRLDQVGNGIIKSMNDKYYQFCLSLSSYNDDIAKTRLKKIDAYKDSTTQKIKEARQEVWDDYWDFVKIAANLMDDVPDYKNSKIELKRARECLPNYSQNFRLYQFEVIEKRERKFFACEKRIRKTIDSFNKKISAFNALNFHLSINNICYKKSTVGLTVVMNEFDTLIDDYKQKVSVLKNRSPSIASLLKNMDRNVDVFKNYKNNRFLPY